MSGRCLHAGSKASVDRTARRAVHTRAMPRMTGRQLFMGLLRADPPALDPTTFPGNRRHRDELGGMWHHSRRNRSPHWKLPQEKGPEGVVRLRDAPSLGDFPDNGLGPLEASQTRQPLGIIAWCSQHRCPHSDQGWGPFLPPMEQGDRELVVGNRILSGVEHLSLDGVPVVSATTLNCQPHQRFRITQTRCPEAPLKR